MTGRGKNKSVYDPLDRVVRRDETRIRPLKDAYHRVLQGSWALLIGGIAATYIAINLLFAGAYLAIGDGIQGARPGSFSDAFDFSVQTFATIGYGSMTPSGRAANLLVALESIVGLISVALATGLVFAKFARPSARVVFSSVAVLTEYDGKPTLMFRMANERSSRIVEASIRVIALRTQITKEGTLFRRFVDVPLVRDRNPMFALTWTVFAPIEPGSVLEPWCSDDESSSEIELFVTLVGLEETLSQTVHARHYYRKEDVRFGERFADVISELPEGKRLFDFRRFHDTVPAEVRKDG